MWVVGQESLGNRKDFGKKGESNQLKADDHSHAGNSEGADIEINRADLEVGAGKRSGDGQPQEKKEKTGEKKQPAW